MKKLSKLLVTVIFCLSIACAAIVPAFAAVAKVNGVKASVTASNVVLSWNKAKNVGGYQIQQYSKDKWKSIAKTTKTTYTVKNLTTGTTYKFRVRAFKTSGKKTTYGRASAAISAKPVCIAPKSFKATVLSPSSAKFTWKAVSSATGYKLQKYDGKKWVDVSKTTQTTLTLSKLATNVAVKYRVLAYKTVGKKVVNGKASATVTVKPDIKVPSNVKVTAATPVSENISWNAVPGVTGYIIYKYDDASKAWTYAAMTGRTSCTVQKLIPSIGNKLRVRAYVQNGDKKIYGAFSNAVSFKTSTIPAPTKLTLNESDSTTATISWNAVSGVTGYAVYIRNSATNKWDWAASSETNSFTLENLPSNSDFTLCVRSYITAVNSVNYFSADSNSVSGHTSPAAVTELKATNLTDKSFTLSWKASADADIIERYEIYALITRTNENGDNISKYEYIGSVPKGTTVFNIEKLDDKALEQKTAYSFKVVGYSFYTKINAAGKPVTNRLYATPTEAIITTALSAVSNFRAENPTSSSVTVSWSNNAKAESYKLEMKKDGEKEEWAVVDLSKCDKVDKGTSVMAYTVKGLEPSTLYSFRITAQSGKITSETSNSISARTAPKSDAVLEKDTVKPTSITIKWNAVPGADAYEIQWIQPGKDWEVLSETDKTNITVNNLTQCTTYRFRMRSFYTKADGTKVYSESFSNELVETTLLSPISLAYRTDAGMTGSDSISVAWVPNSKATSYTLLYKEVGKDSSNEWKEIKNINNKDNVADGVCIYKVTGLKTMTKYSFKGIAECGEVRSTESEVVEGQTAPAKVSGVSVSEISDTTAKISWKTVSGAEKYVVEIKVGDKWLSSNTSEGSKYLTVYSSYCTAKNLEQFTAYSFRVSALRDIDSSIFSSKYITSDYSDEVKVQTKLSAVKDFKFVDATEKSITVSWTINDKAKEYELKMGSSASSVNTIVNDKPVTTGKTCTVTVTFSSASNNVVYFTVAAKNGSNVGIISNTVKAALVPSKVTGLTATDITDTSFKLKWNSNGADKYSIVIKDKQTITVNKNEYTVNSVDQASDYKIYVIAINDADTPISSKESDTITVKTKLSRVSITSAEAKTNSVNLKWSKNDKATEYIVSDGKVTKTVTGCEAEISNLTPGTSYTFTVTPVLSGYEAVTPSGKTVTTLIDNVKNLKVTNYSDTSVSLSWDQVGTATYKVNYEDHEGNPITLPTNSPSIVIKNLKQNTRYSFTVKAIIGSNETEGIEISQTTKLSPVGKITAKVNADNTSVSLSWTIDKSYPVNYQIYKNDNSTPIIGVEFIGPIGDTHTATIKNLEPGTYKFLVVAYTDGVTAEPTPVIVTVPAA